MHQQVLRVLRHRKGNDLTDVRLLREQHHDAIDTRRETAVRRRPVPECREHAAEPLLHFLRAVARELKARSMMSGRWLRMAPLDNSTPLQTMSY